MGSSEGLICKGRGVVFILKDGREVRPPASFGLLHDPSGIYWPKCSMFVASFEPGKVEDDVFTKAKQYLGRTYQVHVGTVSLPPKKMTEWSKLGELEELLYRRGGTKAPGGFRHEFGRKGVFSLFKGRGHCYLYSCAKAFRLELGKGCIADDRGIAFP